jgi:hypothetical protein
MVGREIDSLGGREIERMVGREIDSVGGREIERMVGREIDKSRRKEECVVAKVIERIN